MSEPYTPTTDLIREAWRNYTRTAFNPPDPDSDADAEFDRWFTARLREAWHDGFNDGHTSALGGTLWENQPSEGDPGPYPPGVGGTPSAPHHRQRG